MNQKLKIKNIKGLTIEFLGNGTVKSIEASPIRINLKPGTPYSDPGTNIYLRRRGNMTESHPITGPASGSRFQTADDSAYWQGEWSGLRYDCRLKLAAGSLSWQWQVEIRNTTGEAVELDLVYLQDAGLKPVNAGLINEYYVAQYLERRILEDEKYGCVVCCRQNMKETTGNPWFMLVCNNGATSASTDGMQFYGKTYRATGIPEGLISGKLGGEYAGESPVVAMQENPFLLKPGEIYQSVFFGIYLPDHPEASSAADIRMLRVQDEMGFRPKGTPSLGTPSLGTPSLLAASDLTNEELNSFFGPDRRHEETYDGQLLSFFSGNNHIILKDKEILADRPHGHIMQARAGLVPDENILATTAFAFGVFNSHISQGNTNFNVLLSVCTSQFNQSKESGQRIFVEIDGRFYQLGIPSAFEMGLNHCRWIYKHGAQLFQIRTWTSKVIPQINLDFQVIRGKNVRLILTHDFDPLNGWKINSGKTSREFLAEPSPGSMITTKYKEPRFRIKIHGTTAFSTGSDELLRDDQLSGGASLFIIKTDETSGFCMSFIGEVLEKAETIEINDPEKEFLADCRVAVTEWKDLSLGLEMKSQNPDVEAIQEILPWYGMNALIHFLTPYGLEQFGGAAWGTRDVSQGPVELLLTLGKYEEARKVLCILFSNQNPDGGWPQWWMFDRYREIRAHDSHGDVFYWCLIALAGYIRVTGDTAILEEQLPYFNEKGTAYTEKTPLSEHIERLISMITGSFIPGTALVPFGGGDWNDSLQPVSKELAQRMISSWTVEMNYQAFNEYGKVFETTGNIEKAGELGSICRKIRTDFNRYLVKDGVVAGYGLVENDGSISVLLHPSDTKTGVRYSLLPMERGIISGIFTGEQAILHQELIEQFLKGPDGARLMDRPVKYKGGVQEIFQRAESSTFFGREIGLMYVHEHVRYAETLAITGKADAFVKAMRQAIPVGYRDIVACGDIRQSNCYYSSSDVHFKNRYEADERYEEVKSGKFTVRGGWRVYSSGPGIYISLVITRLLGLRINYGNVIIDPVMPLSIDGLMATMDFLDYPVTFIYSVKEGQFCPKRIRINGKEIAFDLEENKFREGGAVIPADRFIRYLEENENIIRVEL